MSFENKIIAHLPDIEVLIVPDKEQIKLPKKTFKERVLQFSRHRYIEKFKMANKALDFIRYLTIEIDVNNYKCSLEMISMLLSRTFKRSTIIKINDKAYSSYTNIEDQTLFETNIEKTAMSWVLINRTPAGRGTDTLRNANGIYFPIIYKDKLEGLIGFKCQNIKFKMTERILLQQILPTIGLAISLLNKQI